METIDARLRLIEERQDFTERLLAPRRDETRLSPGDDG